MAVEKDTSEEIAALKREISVLSGLALATGVILTQLLQTTCKRELDPQGTAGRIMDNAREGIKAFSEQNNSDPAMTRRALEAVEQYEEQIRSVLRV
ncbi:MAG: hypothetical protein KJ622_08885 [Alphaproteobacteria bacterium]|nr:hypothetical protein [Alphaproteobacteria bacterium]